MAKKKAIIAGILACVIVGLCGWLLLTNHASVTQLPRETVYQQEVRVSIGDRIILGKVTDELADLGTIKKGDKASFNIVIRNGEDEPVGIIASASGNISALITFDYYGIIESRSSGNITVHISGDGEEGSYSGIITVEERVNEN